MTVENDDLDSFLTQLHNEHKETIIKEDSHLHVYSSNNVDMYGQYKLNPLTYLLLCLDLYLQNDFSFLSLFFSPLYRLLNAEHNDNVQEGFLSSPINQFETLQLDPYNSPASNLGTIERPTSTGKLSKFISNHSTPFGQRSNKFVLLFSLNNDEDIEAGTKDKNLEDSEDSIIRRIRPSERCSLQVHCSQPEPGYRFMYDRTEDKVQPTA